MRGLYDARLALDWAGQSTVDRADLARIHERIYLVADDFPGAVDAVHAWVKAEYGDDAVSVEIIGLNHSGLVWVSGEEED